MAEKDSTRDLLVDSEKLLEKSKGKKADAPMPTANKVPDTKQLIVDAERLLTKDGQPAPEAGSNTRSILLMLLLLVGAAAAAYYLLAN